MNNQILLFINNVNNIRTYDPRIIKYSLISLLDQLKLRNSS